jgi:hypothetical protein
MTMSTNLDQDTVPSVAEAEQHCATLRDKLAQTTKALEAAEHLMAGGYRVVAEGGNVPVDLHSEIATHMATQRSLRAMLADAGAALDRAQTRERIREKLITSAEMATLTARHGEVAARLEKTIEALVDEAGELRESFGRIAGAFHKAAGRSPIGAGGVLGVGLREAAMPVNTQNLIEGYLAYRSGWWRSENGRIVRSFSAFAVGQVSHVSAHFDEVLGLDKADPAEVAAVRAEMAATQDETQAA